MLYENDVDMKVAMKWVGHADENMILDIYTHLTAKRENEDLEKIVQSLNEKLY